MYPIKQWALVSWIVDGVHSWTLPSFLYLRLKLPQCSQSNDQVTRDAPEPQDPAFSELLLCGSEVKNSWMGPGRRLGPGRRSHWARLCLFLQAVKRFLKQECKCHGVSGSCTLRTCWLAMADFRKTGDYLWRKYNGAIQVVMNQDGTGFTVANKRFKKPTKNDLVYFENSPDYCIRDREAGKLQEFLQWTVLCNLIGHLCFSAGYLYNCRCLPSGSRLVFFLIHTETTQKILPKQLEKQVDSVQILKKHKLTRMYVAKSQNVQLSRILACTEF